MGDADWRPVVAALAGRDVRAVYARLCLGETTDAATAALGAAKARRALSTLARAGLVRIEEGEASVVDDAFARVLAAAPRRPVRTGVERFLDDDGRIDRYPSSASEREGLLRHVASRVLSPGEVVDERTLGERLLRFGADVAALRRHLVDAGLVERTSSGTEYALADHP